MKNSNNRKKKKHFSKWGILSPSCASFKRKHVLQWLILSYSVWYNYNQSGKESLSLWFLWMFLEEHHKNQLKICWTVCRSLCVCILRRLEANKQEKWYWLFVLLLFSLSSFVRQNPRARQQYVLLVKQIENPTGWGHTAVQMIELTTRNVKE